MLILESEESSGDTQLTNTIINGACGIGINAGHRTSN